MSLTMPKAKREQRVIQRCGTCRYYLEDEDYMPEPDGEPELPTGWCRRFPPRIVPGSPTVSTFPDVSKHVDWCGEFVPLEDGKLP